MNDLVSIIIPLYQVEWRLFLKCINSCINQTYENLEILIMINGTPFDLKEKIKDHISSNRKIKVIECKNKGVSYARNQGIKESKGKWIIFVDADDWIEENYVKCLLLKAIEYDCDLAVCSFKKIYSHSEEKCLVDTDCKVINGTEFIKKIFSVESGVGFAWGKIFKKNFLIENNLFFEENLSVVEDAYFCLEVALADPKTLLVNDVLYNYVFSTGSTVRKFNENYADLYEKAMKKIFDKFVNHRHDINEVYVYNFVAYHFLLICVNYCFNNSNKLNYFGQKRLLKKEISKDIFSKSIKISNYSDFSFTRKVTLIMLKMRLYFIVKIIAQIRQSSR